MRVAVVTGNPAKFAEYQAFLAHHGAKVQRADAVEDALAQADVVLREESNLVEPGTRRLLGEPAEQARPGRVAENLTVLTVHRRGHLPRSFEARVTGYLDPRRRAVGEGVFGWDDVFVMASTQLSYHQMRALGLKRSARDQVLAALAQELLWFEAPVELSFCDLLATRAVDFGVDAARFLREHPFYGRIFDNPRFRGVDRIVRRVLAQGVFFRAARNRRERNYWLPGLNAGVPLTPKRDAFHEATFMMHDLMHFAFPDLLLDPRRDAAARRVYITWRLMSEAFTLVLADMVFVDGWRQEGFPYDYTARRLHPVWDRGRFATVAEALEAAARWMLRDDVSGWERAGVPEEVVGRLRAKYDQYARSDWRWTGRNWERSFRATPRWLELAGEVRRRHGVELLTVAEATEDLERRGQLADGAAVFEGVLGRYLARFEALTAPGIVAAEADGRSQAFRRWLLEQLVVFERFAFFPASAVYQGLLAEQLLETERWDEERVAQARLLLEQYLDQLSRHDIITGEERRIWAEVYPLFDPCYVGYDSPSAEPLRAVIDEVLAG